MGIADTDFLDDGTKELGFNKGELVDITMEQSLEYLLTTMAYGFVIANRQRKQRHDLGPLPMVRKEDGTSAAVDAYRDYYE